MFERTVYEPVLIAVHINRPEAARAIETCLSWPIQRTFVCQTRADYDLFTHELIDKRKWRLNVVELEAARSLASYTPPIPKADLLSLGFDAYALDCIDAPEEVLKYLCSAASLHAIPLDLRGRVRPQDMESRQAVRRYIVADTIFTTTTSSYGRRLPQTMSRVLKPLRSFAHTSDQQERQNAAAALRHLEEQHTACQASIQHAKSMREQHAARVDSLSQQRSEAASAYQLVADAHKESQRLELKLQSQRDQLAHEEAQPSLAVQRREIHATRQKYAVELSKLAERSFRCFEAIVRSNAASDETLLASLHACTDVQSCRASLREQQTRIEEGEQAVRAAVAEFTTIKTRTLELKRCAEQKLQEAGPDVQSLVQTSLEDGTHESVEHLHTLLDRARAQLDVPWGVGPGVMETFRARKDKVRLAGTAVSDQRRWPS